MALMLAVIRSAEREKRQREPDDRDLPSWTTAPKLWTTPLLCV
jgi:hypothetical protein